MPSLLTVGANVLHYRVLTVMPWDMDYILRSTSAGVTCLPSQGGCPPALFF